MGITLSRRKRYVDAMSKLMLTGNIRVCCRLQGTEAVANDEDTRAESPKRLSFECRNGEKSPESIQKQPPDEHGSVTEMSKDPRSVTDGSKRIRATKSVMVSQV